MKQIIALLVLAVSLAGCSTSYGIQTIDGLPPEVYLTLSKGTEVTVGDTVELRQVRPNALPSSYSGGQYGHGGGQKHPRQVEAKVRVTRIVDDTHALVQVLTGMVQVGLIPAKVN